MEPRCSQVLPPERGCSHDVKSGPWRCCRASPRRLHTHVAPPLRSRLGQQPTDAGWMTEFAESVRGARQKATEPPGYQKEEGKLEHDLKGVMYEIPVGVRVRGAAEARFARTSLTAVAAGRLLRRYSRCDPRGARRRCASRSPREMRRTPRHVQERGARRRPTNGVCQRISCRANRRGISRRHVALRALRLPISVTAARRAAARGTERPVVSTAASRGLCQWR